MAFRDYFLTHEFFARLSAISTGDNARTYVCIIKSSYYMVGWVLLFIYLWNERHYDDLNRFQGNIQTIR